VGATACASSSCRSTSVPTPTCPGAIRRSAGRRTSSSFVDGANVWEGFVTELEWGRGGQLVGFSAVGYDRVAHDVVSYSGTYANLLPTVVGNTAPFLRVAGAPPLEGTTSAEFTVADACEFLRRLATDDGQLVDVCAEPGGSYVSRFGTQSR
jgi:hypothetical protein